MLYVIRVDSLNGHKVANNEEKETLKREKVSNVGSLMLQIADLLKCTFVVGYTVSLPPGVLGLV